jgi:hypothetical protein
MLFPDQQGGQALCKIIQAGSHDRHALAPCALDLWQGHELPATFFKLNFRQFRARHPETLKRRGVLIHIIPQTFALSRTKPIDHLRETESLIRISRKPQLYQPMNR